jgi:hypothetical protein
MIAVIDYEKRRKDFEIASKPMIDWLNKHCHPHCKVIVDHERAELVEGLLSSYPQIKETA